MKEIDLGMTNFEGSIDDGLAEALQAEPGQVFGQHQGRNFCGYVYFLDGQFHEDVWVYCVLRETISAETLEELRSAVCDEYGYD